MPLSISIYLGYILFLFLYLSLWLDLVLESLAGQGDLREFASRENSMCGCVG